MFYLPVERSICKMKKKKEIPTKTSKQHDVRPLIIKLYIYLLHMIFIDRYTEMREREKEIHETLLGFTGL